MSRPVTVTIPHTLGKDEAKRRIADGFGQFQENLLAGLSGREAGGRSGGLLAAALRSTMSFQQSWVGDRLEFAGGGLGQKITGRIDVGADAVVMQLDLPEVLAALADRFAGQLQHEGTKLLEHKPKVEWSRLPCLFGRGGHRGALATAGLQRFVVAADVYEHRDQHQDHGAQRRPETPIMVDRRLLLGVSLMIGMVVVVAVRHSSSACGDY